jgi:hypothetical protein
MQSVSQTTQQVKTQRTYKMTLWTTVGSHISLHEVNVEVFNYNTTQSCLGGMVIIRRGKTNLLVNVHVQYNSKHEVPQNK